MARIDLGNFNRVANPGTANYQMGDNTGIFQELQRDAQIREDKADQFVAAQAEANLTQAEIDLDKSLLDADERNNRGEFNSPIDLAHHIEKTKLDISERYNSLAPEGIIGEKYKNKMKAISGMHDIASTKYNTAKLHESIRGEAQRMENGLSSQFKLDPFGSIEKYELVKESKRMAGVDEATIEKEAYDWKQGNLYGSAQLDIETASSVEQVEGVMSNIPNLGLGEAKLEASLYSQANAQINQLKAKDSAANKALKIKINQAASTVTEELQNGSSNPNVFMAAPELSNSDEITTENKSALDMAYAHREETQILNGMTFEEANLYSQAKMTSAKSSESEGYENIYQITSAQYVNDIVNKNKQQFSHDPIGYGIKRYGISPPEDFQGAENVLLSTGDPTMLVDSINSESVKSYQENMKIRSGVLISPLQGETRDILERSINSLDADKKVDILLKLANGGSEDGMANLSQVSKDNQKNFMIGNIATYMDRGVAVEIAQGSKLREDKSVNLKIGKDFDRDMASAIEDEIGDYLSGNPDVMGKVSSAASDLYIQRYANDGEREFDSLKDDTSIERQKLRKIIYDVVGQPVNYHGNKTLKPKEMSEDDFINAMDARVRPLLRQYGWEDLVDSNDIELVSPSVRSGLYVYAIRRKGSATNLEDSEGNPILVSPYK